jgi:uncharacterized membrane protein YphA (DoxX/SURF4 family)
MKRTIAVDIINLFLVSLFLYAAISKLMDYTLFKEQIAASAILRPFARFLSWALPTIEFLAVILLFVPRWRLKGLYMSLVLLMLFTIYIIGLTISSDDALCNCGGLLEQLTPKQHIVFNLSCIAATAIAIVLERRARTAYRKMQASAFA